ncbi:MAG TPA: DUF4384 domain-containing protein [Oculatellaceae cyanobacterium]
MKRYIPAAFAVLMLASTTSARSEGDVRGMYVEQEHNQTVAKNTGLCYYLELKRGEEPVRRCTNKTTFHNGDKIRIKMKSNVDGYAYIVQVQGSDGEKSVLFPSEDLGSNKITAGSWVTLPKGSDDNNAWMKFDKHPGTEVIRMLVSRKKINLDSEGGSGASVVIASRDGEDKVPDGTQVAIVVPKGSKISSGTRNLTVTQDAQPEKVGETTVVGKADKLLAVDMALNHTSGKDED